LKTHQRFRQQLTLITSSSTTEFKLKVNLYSCRCIFSNEVHGMWSIVVNNMGHMAQY